MTIKKRGLRLGRRVVVVAACMAAAAPAAFAETSAGDTAWVLASTALVLLMTLPALALFYGGLVHTKNVLSDLIQCVVIACLMSILWYAVGYSIAFGDGGPANTIWGGFGKAFLSGVTTESDGRVHSRKRVLHVPDDIRHHHASADRWRISRTHELSVGADFRRSGCCWSMRRSATGCGAAAGSTRKACVILLVDWWSTPQQARPRLCSPSCWASGRVFLPILRRLTAPCW